MIEEQICQCGHKKSEHQPKCTGVNKVDTPTSSATLLCSCEEFKEAEHGEEYS